MEVPIHHVKRLFSELKRALEPRAEYFKFSEETKSKLRKSYPTPTSATVTRSEAQVFSDDINGFLYVVRSLAVTNANHTVDAANAASRGRLVTVELFLANLKRQFYDYISARSNADNILRRTLDNEGCFALANEIYAFAAYAFLNGNVSQQSWHAGAPMCDFVYVGDTSSLRTSGPDYARAIADSFASYLEHISACSVFVDCTIRLAEASERSQTKLVGSTYSFQHVGEIIFTFHNETSCALPIFSDEANQKVKLFMPEYFTFFFPDLVFHLTQGLDSFDAGTGFFKQETRPGYPAFKMLFTNAERVVFDRCLLSPTDVRRLEDCKPYMATKETPEPAVAKETFDILLRYIVDTLFCYVHPQYDIDANQYKGQAYMQRYNLLHNAKEENVAKCTAQFLADYTNNEGPWERVSPHQRKLLENQIVNLNGLETAELEVKLLNLGYIIHLMHRDNDIGRTRLAGCSKTLWTRLLRYVGDHEFGRKMLTALIEISAMKSTTAATKAAEKFALEYSIRLNAKAVGRFACQYQIQLRRAIELTYLRNRNFGPEEPTIALSDECIFQFEEDPVRPEARRPAVATSRLSVFNHANNAVATAVASSIIHTTDEEEGKGFAREESQVSIYGISPPDTKGPSPIKQMLQNHASSSSLQITTDSDEALDNKGGYILGGSTRS